MKGKTKSILGVAFTLMMVVSLLMWTAPAMAGNTMEWDDEDIPDTDDFVILAPSDVVDMDVSEGGLTIFAATGTTKLYCSTDKGVTWDDSTVAPLTTWALPALPMCGTSPFPGSLTTTAGLP